MRRLFLLAAALCLLPAVALADDPPVPDKSGYTVFDPVPDNELRSLCTDRPTKSTSPCTVDTGHWQVESDVYNYSTQTADGVTTTTQLFTNPTLKLGLTNGLDVEVNVAPYEQVSTHDATAGVTTTLRGVGDLFVKAKLNLLGDDGGNVAVALEPYVKVPTAPLGVGNGAVEEGILAPIQLALPANWQLVIDPEFDLLANAAGAGRHGNISSLLSFSYPVSKTLTASLEVWGDANFDPAGTVKQASFDLGAAWIPAKAPNFQLDGGVNLGLNRATPGVQAYVGVSRRF
ncbi:MAG TPA: transporter [Caulobacteraceae bacterium]|nr:transporter [Caulobacteraceae bacterium]